MKTVINSIIFQLILAAFSIGTMGQDGTVRIPTEDEFIEIYNVIFPLASNRFSPTSDYFALDIRMEPSYRAPSQLSILKRENGHLEVLRYDFVNSETSLFEQIIKLPQFGKVKSYRELAKELKINRKQIRTGIDFEKQVDEFLLHTLFERRTDFLLDGVTFQVWYVDRGTKFHFEQTGSEEFNPKESKIVSFLRKLMSQSNH